MPDSRNSLRRLVEEGAIVSQRPPLASLRRRAQRRRTARSAAIVVFVAVAISVAIPLAGRDHPRPVATAPPLAPTLVADPVKTTSGGVITVSGAGCAPGQAVSLGLRWDRGAPLSLTMTERKSLPTPETTAPAAGSLELTTAVTLGTGAFSARVTIPGTFDVGKPTLWARCQILTQNLSIEVRNQ